MSESTKAAETPAETPAEQPATLLDMLEEQLKTARTQAQAIVDATTSALTMIAVAKAQQEHAARVTVERQAQSKASESAKKHSTFGKHRSAEGSTS